MNCIRCEKEIPTESNFCMYCGKNQVEIIDLVALRAKLVNMHWSYDSFDEDLQDKYQKGDFCSDDYVSVGGYSGGNCWNNKKPKYSRDEDSNPEYKELLKTLTSNGVPEIQAYYILEKTKILVEWTEYQYYGNTSEKQCYVFPIDEIISYLKTI